jgi:hypothetical protein
LERVLGKKTGEIDIFAETVKLAHEKKLVTRAPASQGRFPVKAIARTPGAAHSNLKRRFENVDAPRCGKWLSYCGNCHTDAETTALARSLGLISCFTPVRSLESNSVPGPFVRAFKRDDVYVHERPYAKR